MLKTFSRTRSDVGRVSKPRGAWIVWPFFVPAMILIAEKLRLERGRRRVKTPQYAGAGSRRLGDRQRTACRHSEKETARDGRRTARCRTPPAAAWSRAA